MVQLEFAWTLAEERQNTPEAVTDKETETSNKIPNHMKTKKLQT